MLFKIELLIDNILENDIVTGSTFFHNILQDLNGHFLIAEILPLFVGVEYQNIEKKFCIY